MTALTFFLACAGTRAGLVNDGMNGGQSQGGCDRDLVPTCGGGLGYDEVVIVASMAALSAVLLILKLRQ